MPSGLTINVSAVASGLVSPVLTHNAAQTTSQAPPTQAQMARFSQASSEAAIVHQGRRADERVSIQIPARVEPKYGLMKKKKTAGKNAPEAEKETAEPAAQQARQHVNLKA